MATKPEPPTAVGRRIVRYVLGFTVGVGVGLAPYLGTQEVPLFAPLISLYPDSVRDVLIVLSTAAMSIVVVGIQWGADQYQATNKVRGWFSKLFAAAIASFIVLIVVVTLTIVRVPVGSGNSVESFVTSFGSRLPQCASSCSQAESDAQCITNLTFNETRIAGCWGDTNVRVATLAILFSYLATTSFFGAIVGCLLIPTAHTEGKNDAEPKVTPNNST